MKPRTWTPFPLTTPVNRKGNIQLPSDPQADAVKRARLLGTTPTFIPIRSK
jgi:hypothetical protein